MMKKLVFSVALVAVIGITGSLGLLHAAFRLDDISEQEYRVSLKEATAIFEQEFHQSEVESIQFAAEKETDKVTNAAYEYLFFCPDKVIAIHPTTGKTVARTYAKKENKNNEMIDVSEAVKSKKPQTAMKEAMTVCGRKDAKAENWEMIKKGGKLYYQIQVAVDDEAEKVLISA